MSHSKKSESGRRERTALIDAHWGPSWRNAKRGLDPGQTDPDDLLDALAVLWSAQRLAQGRAQWLPEEPPADATGLPMVIAY